MCFIKLPNMGKNLIIVESPAKAKTINKFLGKDFLVTSCYGHIRDLPERNLSIDIGNNYEPQYVVTDDKKKLVADLKKMAKESSDIYLATDEDREGEAISWHLCSVLGLDPAKAKRITYTEITEKAIKAAVGRPRTINMDLVNAQQARRVLDRIVGYELSPVLWKKVKPNLSAGRVQSVAVRLIVEREREINQFTVSSAFKVVAVFTTGEKGSQVSFKAECPQKFNKGDKAEAFLNELSDALFSVSNIEKKPGKRTPSAPFTTSTLQQEASRKLGFSVSKTMVVAQRLYEAGHITYMRTDSVNLSETALEELSAAIRSRYGNNYLKTRKYTTKNESAQEAHEAIRPTDSKAGSIEGDRDEQRLYELIWKRTIASQMSDAEIEKTQLTAGNNKNDAVFVAQAEMIVFDGFLKVYMESTDEESETDEEQTALLPPLKTGDALGVKEITATEKFSKPQARYTEASLVKKMEELGIGRPSTYAPTITTIQKRAYVVKESREGFERTYQLIRLKAGKVSSESLKEVFGSEKNKLFPTDIGMLVNDFLLDHFQTIMDYRFTAGIEERFDKIAEGKEVWNQMIDSFYKPFHENVSTTEKESARVTGERILGTDPQSGLQVSVRLGRYGAMAVIGKNDDEENKPRYASLRPGQSIENISLEQALELFKLPRIAGQFEGKEMKVNNGRFGPYIQHDGKFYSLPKDADLFAVNEEEAIRIITEKREADRNKLIADFPSLEAQVLNGRFGPYIKKGKDNFKIPKGTDASTLTEEQVKEIISVPQEERKPKRIPKGKK